ncbi:MAG: Gfo/Idh/MocA family oxidoreductase [Chlorobia bacterium]|nr:Gfo/Idh/MocA family oxidoreductase [Fimbriimonadaceae bacterium]
MRVGVAGLTHGHVWGLIENFRKVEGVELVAVADNTPLLERVSGFGKTYSNWEDMIANENFDALLVTSNNVESSEITVQALNKGIPCMVEKAMAANAVDADRMLAAMHASGKTLMINWPVAWSPWLHEVKRLLDENSIGPVFTLQYRNGHFGPKEIGCDEWFVEWLHDEVLNGGGAIADFCSYGAVLCRWLFGMPETVYCIRQNYTKDYSVPDDYASCILRYPKMQALLEGTWAHKGDDHSANPRFYGRDGSISVQGNFVYRSTVGREEGRTAPPLEVGNSAQYFFNCVKSGKTPEGILNPEIAADACRILDAAKESDKSGCAEKPQ